MSVKKSARNLRRGYEGGAGDCVRTHKWGDSRKRGRPGRKPTRESSAGWVKQNPVQYPTTKKKAGTKNRGS